ncbi:alpha-L-rhamnosidase-related protein [Cohnella nanjingensis]|uniref:Alpha-L-rhamnosidase N-terminal domain-containing protein n=1 Tax=Cohnella nanjingensis TaxID=1387779 RepID=A0A7X0RRR5_9BACL|nr:alpha-L-rhamnosidase N-terminal domain-containing protein [Cohnella nanjingensis]MBB6672492.1 alpha-L-rhamnosidase N-terminal domain-containing protein [Cohnella nanjingensis]
MGTVNWTAKWIWASGAADANNVYAEARQTFEAADGERAGAKLRISANQAYKVYLNGAEIGRGPAPADLSWMTYDTYEVSDRLRSGTNVLAVLAHNFGKEDIVTRQLQGPGGLICQLDLYGTDAGDAAPIRTIASGADWRCRRSPRWKSSSRLHLWGGFKEIVDVAREDGWEQADYDDSAWPFAEVVAEAEQPDSPWPRLLAREIPFLRQTLKRPVAVVSAEPYLGALSSPDAALPGGGVEASVAMDASVPGSLPQITYDFGAEIVGYPELEVYAEEGGVLQLYYGESLEMALMDTFLLRKGSNTLAPFGRRAFRYMKVAALATPLPLRISRLQVRFVHYPFTGEASFQCSDERLNRIWETGRYTTIVNSQHHFEDCPYREAALWVADAVVMAKVVYQTFNDPALVRKSLLQGARIQNADGSIPGTGPQRNPFLLPDFCAHWLFGVRAYYAYTRDRAFIEEIWPYAIKLADWFADQEDEQGLFAGADRDGWWCFIDWSDDIDRRDRATAVSCFYYKFLHTAAFMAEELGDADRAEGFRRRADALRQTIRARFRVPGTGLYADCLTEAGLSSSVTAQTNFAAAWSGIMEAEEAADFVRRHYLTGKLPPIRGAFFYHIVLETLFNCGYAEEAVRLIRDYWGAMLDRGATTWWETFDPSLPFPTTPSPYMGHTPTFLQDSIPVSLSHGWGASPTYLLSSEVLGVNMAEAGIGAVALAPTAVEGIAWASGVIPTPQGDIRAEWKREEGGTVRFRATIPEGLSWTHRGLASVETSSREGGVVVAGTLAAAAGSPASRTNEEPSAI